MSFSPMWRLILITICQIASANISNKVYDAEHPFDQHIRGDDGGQGKISASRADTVTEVSPKLYSIDLEEKQLLCARVKCLETEFCIVKDHMVACVKMEELFRNNHSKGNNQQALDGDNAIKEDFNLRGLESVCIPCPAGPAPPAPRDFVCGSDGRTYATPCQLSYEACLQRSQIILTLPAPSSRSGDHQPLKVECRGFCPCQNSRPLSKVPQQKNLQQNINSTILPLTRTPLINLDQDKVRAKEQLSNKNEVREPKSYETRGMPLTYSQALHKLLSASNQMGSLPKNSPKPVGISFNSHDPEPSIKGAFDAKKKRYWAVLLRERDRIAEMLRNSFAAPTVPLSTPANESKGAALALNQARPALARTPTQTRFYRGDHVAVPSIVDRFAPPLLEGQVPTLPPTTPTATNECTHEGMVSMKERLLHWFDSLATTETHGSARSAQTHPYQMIDSLSMPAVEPMECSEDDGTGRPLHRTWWMFGNLDVNSDRYLDISELRHLEAPYMSEVEPCFKPFLDSCDSNQDTLLSTFEWCSCFRDTRKPCFMAKIKVNPSLRKSYIPSCDDSGFFKPEQCHDKTCWCVSPEGAVIPHSTMFTSKDTFHCSEAAKDSLDTLGERI